MQTKFNINQLVYRINKCGVPTSSICDKCNGKGALIIEGIAELCTCNRGKVFLHTKEPVVRDYLIKKIIAYHADEIYYFDDPNEEDADEAFLESELFATKEEAELSIGAVNAK